MKWAPILIILALSTLLFSCGERAPKDGTATFNLQFDTSTLTSNSSAGPGDRPADPLFVAGKGRLEFFGLVVRAVDGAALNPDGTPAGVIIAPASKMLTAFTNEAAMIDIWNSGQANAELTVPMNTKLTITTYLVFIGEDIASELEGPTTLTTVFDVSSPFEITSPSQVLNLSVDTNNVLDDARPFVNWYGAFTDAAGNVMANTNIFLRHCKIGFEFSQAMLGLNPRPNEKNIFRTDIDGWIKSITVLGVDFEVRANNTIVRPCGSPLIAKSFPASPKIAFTGFKGITRYNQPDQFWTALPSPTQTQMFGAASVGDLQDAGIGNDADGDGLTTSMEMDFSFTNPFQKNTYFDQYFNFELSGTGGLDYDKSAPTTKQIVFSIPISDSCASATMAIYEVPGTGGGIVNFTPAFNDLGSGTDSRRCNLQFTPVFGTAPSDNGFHNYVIELNTGISSVTVTDPDGAAVPVRHYLPMRMADGTAANDSTLTAPTMTVSVRDWNSNTAVVVNPLTLRPLLGTDYDTEHEITVTATDLTSGGIYFFGTEATCNPTNKDENIYTRTSFEAPGLAVISIDYHENYNKTVWACHMNAINTTESAAQTQTLGQLNYQVDTTASYGINLDQYTAMAFASPYNPQSLSVESLTRQVVCGIDNNFPRIDVLDSGVTATMNLTGTALNGISPGDAFGFVGPNGKTICSYNNSASGNIILVEITGTTAADYSTFAITGASNSTSKFAYRNGILFVLFQGAALAEGIVYNVETLTVVDNLLPADINEANVNNLTPVITSGGNYIVGHLNGQNIDSYYYNGTDFVPIAGSSKATTVGAPINIWSTSNSTGDYYLMTAASTMGAAVYKANEITSGSLLLDASSIPVSSGINFLGITKNRLTYTNGAEAKYLDEGLSDFVNVMGYSVFYFIMHDASVASFFGDEIIYAYANYTNNTIDITKIVTK